MMKCNCGSIIEGWHMVDCPAIREDVIDFVEKSRPPYRPMHDPRGCCQNHKKGQFDYYVSGA